MRREGYSSCPVCVCVCMYVCMYICLSEHAILAVRAIRSVTKDAIVLSVRFTAIGVFLKIVLFESRASFTHLGRGGHL